MCQRHDVAKSSQDGLLRNEEEESGPRVSSSIPRVQYTPYNSDDRDDYERESTVTSRDNWNDETQELSYPSLEV